MDAEYKEVASGDSLICGTDGVQPAYSNAVKLDKLSNYEAENVRYVKVTLSEGAVNYGYVINEICNRSKYGYSYIYHNS